MKAGNYNVGAFSETLTTVLLMYSLKFKRCHTANIYIIFYDIVVNVMLNAVIAVICN